MLVRLRSFGLILLILTGVYLYAFPSASIPYLAMMLGHVAGGFIVAGLLLPVLRRIRSLPSTTALCWLLIAIGATLGITLTFTGATRPFAALLYAHIFLCAIGVIFLLAHSPVRFAILAVAAGTIAGAAWTAREVVWRNRYRIQNPTMPPESQDFEGAGIQGDFFPSSATTSDGKKIDS